MLTLTGAPTPTIAQLEELVGAGAPPLASADDVESVAALLRARYGLHTGSSLGWSTPGQQVPAVPGQGWSGGDRVYAIRVSPGTIAVAERVIAGMSAGVDDDEQVAGAESHRVMAQGELRLGLDDEAGPKRGEIREWSGPSRARLVRAIAELDLSSWEDDGGNLCAVTLSLPDRWHLYAPGGAAAARLLRAFRRKWERDTGRPWRVLWKREFQDRGAPHFHLLMRVPALVKTDGGYGRRLGYEVEELFETWVARTWADIGLAAVRENWGEIQADYERRDAYAKHLAHGVHLSWSGIRYRDPRRIGVYFLKHSVKSTGSKEYQNVAPKEWRDRGDVGRFWGYAGLQRAVAEIVVSRDVWVQVRRVLRHLARADGWRIDSERARHGVGVCEHRCVCTRGGPRRRRRRSLVHSGGWVLLNDALRTAVLLLDRPLQAASPDTFPALFQGARA